MSIRYAFFSVFLVLFGLSGMAQEAENQGSQTSADQTLNIFSKMTREFATPNQFRTASGSPGPAYYQNEADYKMDIKLDDRNQRLTGRETITYHNNSPDALEFLWVQLDQNMRAPDAPAKDKDGSGLPPVVPAGSLVANYMDQPYEGGFNITEVSTGGKSLPYFINNTMMRVDLPEPLQAGESFSFDIAWWYNINNYILDGGRSGYEYFEEDGNYLYVMAQFFPRMAVYDDVEGWQTRQFWGDAEWALPFGDYEVSITVPADHVLEATGDLQNRNQVYSRKMMRRFEEAKDSYDQPVIIVTQQEAEEAEKSFSGKTKTWQFKAERVRDFAFATSRKFILDMMAVKVGEKDVMAVSLYPKEGNPLWEEFSTKVVAHTLQSYSEKTFDYPYSKAVSVHADRQGMEYPMICWNHGRPNPDGTYSDAVKFGMISVIMHEIGHNFFPMVVNNDEREWGWMDEGLNAFLQYHSEQEFGQKYPEVIQGLSQYPSRRGEPASITRYMAGDPQYIAPIMSNPENIFQLGNNAYGKPAAGLTILRETIMGPEAFDFAFKTYARRWMFKHPTPEDFFRTMEDASGVELDWFWRGWFYRTGYVDLGVREVQQVFFTEEPTPAGEALLERFNISDPGELDALFVVTQDELSDGQVGQVPTQLPRLSQFLEENFSAQERAAMNQPQYFYEVTFERLGEMPMPLIVEYTYSDGSTQRKKYPVQIWRMGNETVSKIVASDKEITKVVVDPDLETADVDLGNNTWNLRS